MIWLSITIGEIIPNPSLSLSLIQAPMSVSWPQYHQSHWDNNIVLWRVDCWWYNQDPDDFPRIIHQLRMTSNLLSTIIPLSGHSSKTNQKQVFVIRTQNIHDLIRQLSSKVLLFYNHLITHLKHITDTPETHHQHTWNHHRYTWNTSPTHLKPSPIHLKHIIEYEIKEDSIGSK